MQETPPLSIQRERLFLASVVDSSKDSVVTIDFNSIITSWNKAAERLYGYGAKEVIGKSLAIVVLPEDIRQLLVNIERIKHSKNVEIYDTIRIRKGGELINLEIMLSPVKNDFDKVIGVSTIARDITAWVKADAALRASEEKFRAIVSQTTVGIYQADLSSQITFANDTLCRLLMLSSEQLIGQPISALTFKEDVQQELDLFATLHETKQPFEADKRVTQSDAKIKWVRQSVSPILDPEGNLESIIGVWIDITEQKEIDRHKDEFISIASHELKTPLTSLHAYGEILEEKLRRGDQVDILSLVKKLNHQIQRFKKLIMQLLDTGKITAGNLVISKARFNLTKVISDLIEEMSLLSPKHHLKLLASEPVEIYAEQERITQVLTNLISNAIKYSPNGGNVTIDCKQVDGNTSVSVSDEGLGIPDQFHKKVLTDSSVSLLLSLNQWRELD